MKINQTYEFKKIPTSELDAFQEENSSLYNSKFKENYELKNKMWFIIIVSIFSMIFIFWISTEIFLLLYKNGKFLFRFPKLSIIINTFDKKDNLTNLLRSLFDQSISSYEIIITKNFPANYSALSFGKFKRKNVKIKILEYSEKDTNLKIKIDCVSRARGDYILFLNPNDYFTGDVLGYYFKKTTQDKIDITQFALFHDGLNMQYNEIIYKPILFYNMFFDGDNIRQPQFHLNGKIIKKETYLDSVKDLDNYYIEQNNKFFDETIITFFLFKKAESYIKLVKRGIKIDDHYNSCPNFLFNKRSYTNEEIKYILLYLRFLIEYTDYKVQEKRMAAKTFIDLLVNKSDTKFNYSKNEIKLLNDVVDLYSKCDLINEYEINLIKSYKKDILDKLKLK